MGQEKTIRKISVTTAEWHRTTMACSYSAPLTIIIYHVGLRSHSQSQPNKKCRQARLV